jgi:hypothetical protein
MGPINNALYPKPATTNSAPVLGEMLAVTSGAAVQFAAFNSSTDCVVLDIQSNNVYCTFDGQTPSSTKGHILYATQSYTWSAATAKAAKFIATGSNATIWGSQMKI